MSYTYVASCQDKCRARTLPKNVASHTLSLMICVLCKHPAVSTHSKYKGDYIKLLVCGQCHNVVDKYIEYDNVLLFLDILLLKPQAYRHFCYNYMEPLGHHAGRILARFFTMMVLFEVYLLWAYEEKKSVHGTVISYVLEQLLHVQYLVFIVEVIARNLVFIGVIMVVVRWWSRENSALLIVVATTVLVANGIKLVPILMLIWPYDTTIRYEKVVVFMAAVNVVESLNSVTDLGYVRIGVSYVVAVVCLECVSRTAMAVVVGRLVGQDAGVMVGDSWREAREAVEGVWRAFVGLR